MKNLRRASIILGVLAGTGGAVGVLSLGCGTDTTGGGAPDSGSADGQKDGQHVDSRADVKAADHSVADTGHDGGRDGGHDAGQDSNTDTGHDSGRDVNIPDVIPDRTPDVGKDVVTIPDVGTDQQSALAAFPTEVTKAYCQRLKQCCTTPVSVAACVALFDSPSVGGAVANVATMVPSAHVTISPSDRSNCLSTISQLPCGETTTAENLQMVKACTAAINGTLAIGQTGCKSPWDCVQPAYCKQPGDAGTCTALIAPNQPCTDVSFSQDCASLGDVPGFFCGPFNSPTPTCLAAEGDGGACLENAQCLSTYCGASGCVTSEDFAGDGGAVLCTLFPPPDGGDGG